MSERTPGRVNRLWNEWGKPILIAILVLGTLRSAVADWNDVPTSSMRPSIVEGDRIFIDKTAYDWRMPFVGWRISERSDPERGDIVIFPSPVDGRRLVKRIMGLPGDRIELRNNRLLVNREAAAYSPASPEQLAVFPEELLTGYRFLLESTGNDSHLIMTTDATFSRTSFGPVVVPDGHYFALGDNRDNSLDSRIFGAIPRDTIHGRALAIALSVDPENYYLPRWERFFTSLP